MKPQAAIDSLTERSPNTSKREQDSREEDTTDADIEVTNTEDTVKEHGKIENDEERMKIHGKHTDTSNVNPSENVLTMEEVKEIMKKKEISVEGFRPEAVQSDLQRLLTFFDRKLTVPSNYVCTVPLIFT